MEDRYYMVAILHWPAECADDPAAVTAFPSSYAEAVKIARPWAEIGSDVVITTRKYKDNDEGK